MSPLLDLQFRFRELGRIRAGEKDEKGLPRKRTTWRLTSASLPLLEQAASLPEIGGTVRPWEGAPDEGYWELLTETDRLDVMIPPVADSGALLSQHYELWSGGGCVRRCDGLNEALSGKPCLCDPDERECKPTTRLSVMMPRLGGIGVWRLDTGGIYAALELPGAFSLIVRAAEGQFMPAVLRLEQRSSRKDGQTRRYAVPVLDMEQATILDLVSGQTTAGVLGPAVATGRPELPPAGEPPQGEGASFRHEQAAVPAHGEPPPLPGEEPEQPEQAGTITQKQRARLFAIASERGMAKEQLRELVLELTGQESTAGMTVGQYEELVAAIEARERAGAA